MDAFLLFTRNFNEARREIIELGGQARMKFSDRMFVADLPSTAISLLKASSLTAPDDLDGVSYLMTTSWTMVISQNSDLSTMTDDRDEKDDPDIDGEQDVDNVDEIEETSEPATSGVPTSLVLKGEIALGLILVSGPPAHSLFINQSEASTLLIQVMRACLFMARAGGQQANLLFVFDFMQVTITEKPPAKACRRSESQEPCERIYRIPALKALGIDDTDRNTGCLALTNRLIQKHATRYGYLAFFSKYPGQPAYAGNTRICINYFNGKKGVEGIARTFVHETFHIFGASDEYRGSRGDGGPSGFLKFTNPNCQNLPSGGLQLKCLMRENVFDICPFTRAQIGWIPTALARPVQVVLKPIFVLPPATDKSLRIETWYWDDCGFLSVITKISGQAAYYQNYHLDWQIQPTRLMGKPFVLVTGDGELRAFYRDVNESIIEISLTSAGWHHEELNAVTFINSILPSSPPKASGDPVAVFYAKVDNQPEMHVLYADEHLQICDMYLTPSGWKYQNLHFQESSIEEEPMTIPPMVVGDLFPLTCLDNQLHIFYRDDYHKITDIYFASGSWHFTTLNMEHFPEGTVVPDCAGNPFAVQYGDNALHVLYRDKGMGISDFYHTDGWHYQNLTAKSSFAPKAFGDPFAVVDQHGQLHILYRDQQNCITGIFFDGHTWSVKQFAETPPANGDPFVRVEDPNEVCVVYQDSSNAVCQFTYTKTGAIVTILSINMLTYVDPNDQPQAS